MVQCSVINCKNNDKGMGVRLFRVPSALKNQCPKSILLSERRRAFWLERLNKNLQDKEISPHTRVCGRHFVTGQSAALFDYKNPDWAPTLYMGYDQSHLDAIILRQQVSLSEDLKRLESRLQSMFQPATNPPVVKRTNESDPLENISSVDVQVHETVECKPEIVWCEPLVNDEALLEESVNGISEPCEDMPQGNSSREETEELRQKVLECEQNINGLKTQIETLRENNSTLLNTVANLILHEDTLRNDDSKVAYYTGLPSFGLLMQVFGLVSEKVADSPLYVVPKFQQFLMVLMRLRLNLQEQDLAYRFNVSVSTVNMIFYRMLTAMSCSLEQYIVWPDRESLIMSMPMCFKKEWGDCVVVVIDCFEVFMENSTSLLSRGTLSQYKVHNTVKFLIGISPQETISYISSAYRGGTSDKFILEECGILDYLLLNDIVIADRNFNDAKSVDFTGARLVVQTLTKGKPHLLCYDDAEINRKVASVRTHVEKLIGLVRYKYSILNSFLPVQYINQRYGDESVIYHIVRVCCALTNLSSKCSFGMKLPKMEVV